MTRGRKSSYTPEKALKIVELASSISENKICQMDGMPDPKTLRCWKKDNPEFRQELDEARALRAERIDDARMDGVDCLRKEIAERTKTGEGFPPGVVEAWKSVFQELAREAAILDDSRYGDRKKVNVEARIEPSTPKGLNEIYAKLREEFGGAKK